MLRRPWKKTLHLGILLISFMFMASWGGRTASVPELISFQGQLLDSSGNPLDGAYSIAFSLYNVPTGGTALWSETQTVTVVNGLFHVLLGGTTPGLANVFAQNDTLYLGIQVESDPEMSPRQRIVSVGYALVARTLADQSCGAEQAIQGWNNGVLSCINVILGGSAWSLTGNAGTDPTVNFIGTTDDTALEIRVNGKRALRIEPHNISPNLIGGHPSNSVATGVGGATIGGGGEAPGLGPNRVNADFGTIGGGAANTVDGEGATISGGIGNRADGQEAVISGGTGNRASGFRSTIGGGETNTASGYYSTIAGGSNNIASNERSIVVGGGNNVANGIWSAVGGGFGNTSSGVAATVIGGSGNTASGNNSVVGGGYLNTAAGDYSFVVGRRAKNTNAAHDGVFLFADSNNFDFPSTAANQFRVRATGGTEFVSAIDGSGNPTAGVALNPGAGAWSTLSDRNLKENFKKVDKQIILEKLVTLPIHEWNWKAQDDSIRHLGPTAQDFYAAFGLGESDRYISTVDADGVALMSIQALYELLMEQQQLVQSLQVEIQQLRSQLSRFQEENAQLRLVNESLHAQLDHLLERVEALEEALRER